jgi:hypothetical protein
MFREVVVGSGGWSVSTITLAVPRGLGVGQLANARFESWNVAPGAPHLLAILVGKLTCHQCFFVSSSAVKQWDHQHGYQAEGRVC